MPLTKHFDADFDVSEKAHPDKSDQIIRLIILREESIGQYENGFEGCQSYGSNTSTGRTSQISRIKLVRSEYRMNTVASATSVSAQEAINGRLYRQHNLVRTYKTTKLSPAEAVAMIRYRDQIEHCRVLDLGCGAGRMTIYLRPLTQDVVGLDISPHMIAHCRQTFPELTFLNGDMRDLSPFGEEEFDSVLAVSNLFDAVSHDERLTVLAEVRRVMASGGILIFSAHNRNYVDAGTGPHLEFHRNPLTQLRMIADYLQAATNHHYIKPFHRYESEYALLNDSGNNFYTLHYYISHENQARQLREAGFELLECLDESGLTLAPDDPGCANHTLMYVARK